MSTIQRAMLVDTSRESRARMLHLLSKAPLFMVGESGYGQRAVTLAAAKRSAVAFISIKEPITRALATVNMLRTELPDATLIAYAADPSGREIRETMRAGADGVLTTPIDGNELLAMLAGRGPHLADAVARADDADADAPAPAARPAPGSATAPLARRSRGQIFTVFHIKGGVGGSTISANLGAAIASQTGGRVLAVDLDSRFGDLATLMNLTPEFALADLADVVADEDAELDREVLARATVRHESGVDFLCAPQHPADWRPVSADQLRPIIEFAARLYDYVILDAPSTLDDVTATAIELADRTLLVSSYDRSSVYATARVADLLRHAPETAARLRLVLNDVQDERTTSPERIHRAVGLEIHAAIPYDPALLEAAQSGLPVVTAQTRSVAALSLHALAGDLAGYLPQAAAPKPAWSRVIGWAAGREPVKARQRRRSALA